MNTTETIIYYHAEFYHRHGHLPSVVYLPQEMLERLIKEQGARSCRSEFYGMRVEVAEDDSLGFSGSKP